MLTVPVLDVSAHCESCGHRSTLLDVGHTFELDGRTYRANRIRPCGCLLSVTGVDAIDASTPDRYWRRDRVPGGRRGGRQGGYRG